MPPSSAELQTEPNPASAADTSAVRTISAVICTRNRGQRLSLALESLANQTGIDHSRAEVIVVDNSSTDDTRQVAESFRPRMPFHYVIVEEPEVGLGNARSKGLSTAAGDVVAFLDDDAIASAMWLAAHLAAYSFAEQVGGVMGRIVPEWEAERPEWLDSSLEPFLTIVDHGGEPFLLEREDLTPVGANMSFLRSAAREAGGFNPNFGFGGRLGIPHDETELVHRLVQRGWRFVYWPDACVRHAVSAERLTWKWLSQRLIRQGRGDFYLDFQRAGVGVVLRRFLLSALLRGPALGLIAIFDYSVGNRARAARRGGAALECAGYALGVVNAATARFARGERHGCV
ncbi:MAG: glycosyl transferase family 2 [Armatimonadota bacterium]|nr:MAG: glycosyl transferase family 2 [Armatimonadota bacterium]